MERRQRQEYATNVSPGRGIQRRRECMEVGVFWIQVELDPDPDSSPALDLGSGLVSGSTFGSRSRVWSRDLDLDLDPVKDPATGSGFGSHIWIKIGIPMRILFQGPQGSQAPTLGSQGDEAELEATESILTGYSWSI